MNKFRTEQAKDEEIRLFESLRRDSDSFLASASDDDFIFAPDNCDGQFLQRHGDSELIKGDAFSRKLIFGVVVTALLLLSVTGAFYRLHSAPISSDDNNPLAMNAKDEPLSESFDDGFLDVSETLTDGWGERFLDSTLYSLELEKIDSVSRRFFEEDVDSVMNLPSSVFAWRSPSFVESEGDDAASSTDVDSGQEDEFIVASWGDWTPKRLFMASSGFDAIVFALKQFYNE